MIVYLKKIHLSLELITATKLQHVEVGHICIIHIIVYKLYINNPHVYTILLQLCNSDGFKAKMYFFKIYNQLSLICMILFEFTWIIQDQRKSQKF